jgi:hypothetical protein
MEERILGLKNKAKNYNVHTIQKKKKRIRNYEENMEDLWDTTKGPNHIFGVEEGAEI